MKRVDVDYGNPLGIGRKEWAKVLGANLAILLVAYAAAVITTLCGSDFFVMRFEDAGLQGMESTLRSWGVYPLVQIAFSTIEFAILSCYLSASKPKWWYTLSHYAALVAVSVLFEQLNFYLSWIPFAITAVFLILSPLALREKPREKWYVYLYRFAIASAISFIMNLSISAFRTRIVDLWQIGLSASLTFALNIEYDIALCLSLGLVSLLRSIHKERKPCTTCQVAGGSSPTLTNSSPKNSPKQKKNPNNETLSDSAKKRLRLIRLKVFAIQSVALIVVAAFPVFIGREIEFALAFASFCLTRLMLGFKKSLHFKSELLCVSAGGLLFWAVCLLAPSAEASIAISVAYGSALAIGFRLYWELHDLILFRRAAKYDRYAMLYCAFKGDISPSHITGIMMMHGYPREDIRIVIRYMAHAKVESIAYDLNYAKITIEKRLTKIAEELYNSR